MKNSGFTLIEIIVAAVIIVLLASISVPLGEMMFTQAKVDDVQLALGELRGALEAYKAELGRYPQIRENETVIEALERSLVGTGILKSLPKNPVTNSQWDWEMRDSVSDSWFRMTQFKPNPSGAVFLTPDGTGVFTPVATAIINPDKYPFPTDIYDIRFPRDIQLQKDNGVYYYEF
ncbi:MAG: prepilin-type N-terminal cleavage/methylation domain-containing protein [Candidatus Wallbacteria bacterium]|nr:prepilin-type N-terminal cleavage/methylation domain-containing protein [Candidatus Wallbacteria bacterium]